MVKLLNIAQSAISSNSQSLELILKKFGELSQKFPESIAIGLKILIEFLQELTNIKNVDLRAESFRSLDICINIKKDIDIPITKNLAGIGNLETLRLSKSIQMHLELHENNRELEMKIEEGLFLVLSFIFLTEKQVIPLKGKAKILKDEHGELIIESTNSVPNSNFPVSMRFPLRKIFEELRKQTS